MKRGITNEGKQTSQVKKQWKTFKPFSPVFFYFKFVLMEKKKIQMEFQ